MSLSIVVVDGTDGTAVATISGSDSATTNTLYKAAWTGQAGFGNVWTYGQLTWTTVGTRSGDGNISLTGAGFWLWNVVGTVSAAPAFASVYQPITDASALSIEEQILNAVQVRLQGLNLPGIASDRIVTRWIARRTPGVDLLPCVAVAVWGAHSFPSRLNTVDDIGIPVAIALLDGPTGGDDRKNLSRNTKWYETVESAFRFQRLAGISCDVYDSIPEPASLIDQMRYTGSGEIVQLIVLRFITRQTRG